MADNQRTINERRRNQEIGDIDIPEEIDPRNDQGSVSTEGVSEVLDNLAEESRSNQVERPLSTSELEEYQELFSSYLRAIEQNSFLAEGLIDEVGAMSEEVEALFSNLSDLKDRLESRERMRRIFPGRENLEDVSNQYDSSKEVLGILDALTSDGPLSMDLFLIYVSNEDVSVGEISSKTGYEPDTIYNSVKGVQVYDSDWKRGLLAGSVDEGFNPTYEGQLVIDSLFNSSKN